MQAASEADPRMYIRGHDFVHVLRWELGRYFLDTDQSEEACATALFGGALPTDIAETPMFRELSARCSAA
jgi:hypothetical protein